MVDTARERRALVGRELKEQAWAAYHLNFPYNKRGFGPWENEQISYSDKRGGSILGLGLIDNPFSETDAERAVKLAQRRNDVRMIVREKFNRGLSFEEIRFGLEGVPNRADVPQDLAEHYGVSYKLRDDSQDLTPAQREATAVGFQAIDSLPFPFNVIGRRQAEGNLQGRR